VKGLNGKEATSIHYATVKIVPHERRGGRLSIVNKINMPVIASQWVRDFLQ